MVYFLQGLHVVQLLQWLLIFHNNKPNKLAQESLHMCLKQRKEEITHSFPMYNF